MTAGGYPDAAGIGIDLEHGILRVTLDRPQRRNALTDVMVAALISTLERAGQDEAVRAVVLSGSGDHFCSGFDIVERNTPGDGPRPRVGSIQRRLPAQAHRLIPLVMATQVPVICAVRGWCAGIGLHLAVAADFAVVADDARMWEPFTARGFTPDSGATWLMPRRVGEVRARELLLLGRALSGREAAEWGLVHRAVPPGELAEACDELALQLASGPTVALGLVKLLLHRGATSPLDAHLGDEAYAMELSSRSHDFREGLAAFKEKRPPHFEGR